MSLEFPSWLEWLGWVIGADWPAGDEDAMRRLADAWTAMGTALGDASDNGDQAADLVMTALNAADGRAFDKTWSAYSGDDEAYLSKLKDACDGLAALCEGCAEDIEYAKYTFYVMLVLLAIDIAIMVAAAAATFGGSLVEIAVEEGLTQLAARRVATMVVEKIAERTAEKAAEFSIKQLVKEGIKGTLKGELPDAVAQTIMYARGDEKGGWNFARTGNSVLSAGAGAVLGGGADALGNKTGLGRAVFSDSPLGEAVKGAVVGGATPFAVGAVTGEPASWHDIAEGASGGAAGGALGFAKDKTVEWFKSRPGGEHVALPDADPAPTLLASSSGPATDTSTVDISTTGDAARSTGSADTGTTSAAAGVAPGSAAAHGDSGAPAGAVRTESARTTTHMAPERSRITEPARHDTADSPGADRPRRTVDRAAPPAHDGARTGGAPLDAPRTRTGSDPVAARDDGPRQPGAQHAADGGAPSDRSRQQGTDAGAAPDTSRPAGGDRGIGADRPQHAASDSGEASRDRSRTADTAAAQHSGDADRTSAARSRTADAARTGDGSSAADRGRGGDGERAGDGRSADRSVRTDDARHAADRSGTTEPQTSRQESSERPGRGSATPVNHIDAVLNPPARPARPTASETAESETTATSARRTDPSAADRSTAAAASDRAQNPSRPADAASTDRHATAAASAEERPSTDSTPQPSRPHITKGRVAPEDPGATLTERSTTSPETIEKLGYDPHDPGFRDPGYGVNTVHHEGREWVRLADEAGWHRVDYRSTDPRYAGKGFAARLKTFVGKYFHAHDGRTAEDLFNEARGKIAYEVPEALQGRYAVASHEEMQKLSGIRDESRLIELDDDEGTHRVIQKVFPKKDIPQYVSGLFGGITGFITKLVDVTHLRTPRDIVEGLRLDYEETPYSPDQGEIYAIRMRVTEQQAQHEIVIPSSQGMMSVAGERGDATPRKLYDGKAPFSGSGFSAEARKGAPELLADNQNDKHRAVALQEGAEMWRITSDGHEELVAVYHSGRWQSTAPST